MEIKNVEPITVFCQTVVTNMKEIKQVAEKEIAPLCEEAGKVGIKEMSPMQFVYTGCSEDPESDFTLDIAIPVDTKDTSYKGKYQYKQLDGYKCLSTMHKGSMEELSKAWENLISELFKKGLKPTDEGREVYHKYIDFSSEENLTELQMGIID